jgi:inorganic pyrophosphatase
MTDESGDDAKLLAVPIDSLCQAYRKVRDYHDLSQVTIDQIAHFFEHYKDLDEGKWARVKGWAGVEEAKKEILDSIEMYIKAPEKTKFLIMIPTVY